VLVEDVATETRFRRLMLVLRENGVRSYCSVPLTTALRRLGARSFGSFEKRTFQKGEIAFMQRVARQVAVAVDNVLHEASARQAQQQLTRERDRMRLVPPDCIPEPFILSLLALAGGGLPALRDVRLLNTRMASGCGTRAGLVGHTSVPTNHL
jgi:hypothetical protein